MSGATRRSRTRRSAQIDRASTSSKANPLLDLILRRLAEPEPSRRHTASAIRARLMGAFATPLDAPNPPDATVVCDAHVAAEALASWVAQNFDPERLFAPRGWTRETLSTKKNFHDEVMRRRRLSRGIEYDWLIEAEAYLALGRGSLEARLHWIEVLKTPPRLERSRGRAPHVNVARDSMIWVYVNIVCLLGQLKPTRNDASEKASGCSVVSSAMSIHGTPIAEKTVEGIYRQFERKLEVEDDQQQWIEGRNSSGQMSRRMACAQDFAELLSSTA